MCSKIGSVVGLVLAFSLSAAAQTKPGSNPAPKNSSPWFLLTGPKQVTGTNASSTPHFNQQITFTNNPADGTFNVPYNFQLTATGQSTGATLSWFLNTDVGFLPPNLSVSANGVITGTPVETGPFSFGVFVNDQQGDFGNVTYTINIGLAVFGNPPADIVGTPYPSFQFSAAGGGGPYVFQVASGSAGLPRGLSLSSAGVVSGTPTQAGSFPVTIQATDTFIPSAFPRAFAQPSGTETVVFTINACTPTFLTPISLTSGDIGSPYTQAITVTGCTAPYTFAISQTPFTTTTLPPGLSLAQPATGTASAVISGTPSTGIGDPYSFNVTVTEANNGTATSTFTIVINPQLAIAATSPLPTATVGQLYSQSLMPTGGTQPYSSLTLDTPPPGMTLDSPSGLLHGTPPAGSASATPYRFTATLIDNLAAQVSKSFQLTIMTAQPALLISPTTLNFTAVQGGPPPMSQAISVAPVVASSSGAKFSVLTDAGQTGTKPPFTLSVSPGGGSAPSQLVVSVDQGSLGAGNTSGRIRIFDQNSVETDVAVNLSVTTANLQLQVTPSRLRFAASTTSPGTLEQDLTVSATGAGGSLGFSANVVNGSSWITVTPLSGQTTRSSAVFVRVLVNTAGQSVGSHTDTIHFSSAGGTADVNVMLIITNGGPALGLDVTGLRYQAQQGGGFSDNETVEVLNVGDPATTIHWTAQIVSGSNIVSLGATSGTATSTSPGSLPINLNSAATALAPGAYYALISVTDPNSSNSPVYVVVVLDLAPSGTPPRPDPDPTGLFFAVAASGAQSPAKTIAVNTSTAAAVAFQVAASTADGGNWLVVNPTSAQTSGVVPGSFTVSVNPAALTPGVYSGAVSISIGAVVRTVNITVVVLPAGSTIPSASERGAEVPHASSCTPSKVAISEIGLANNFSVPAKWPATLIVQLNDDCANSVTNGAVVASFSNGDVPISLLNAGQGANYSATWQPSSTSSQMVVTLNATSSTLAPASLQLVGGVSVNSTTPPVLAPGGTVNAFNPVSGGALSPGTIVEMFGSGLAASSTSTGLPPLPVTFSGTTVLVGGLSAPIYFVSTGQLNVQIPAELPANQSYPVLVSVNGAITLPDQLDMVTLTPGVDASTNGNIVAQHVDFSLVTPASPAKPGETVIIYLLGMGATNPPVASGQPAPSSPLAQVTSQPTITVAGQNAHVDFAGLTPGFAGLYQVDFDVPATVSAGNLTVVISQNGVTTNTTTLPVSQ